MEDKTAKEKEGRKNREQRRKDNKGLAWKVVRMEDKEGRIGNKKEVRWMQDEKWKGGRKRR